MHAGASPPSPPPPPPRPPPPPPPPPPTPPPPVRLVPGPFTGRLEIYHATPWRPVPSSAAAEGAGAPPSEPRLRRVAAWGTVCDDGFDRADATVACRQLGLGPPLRYWTLSTSDRDDEEEEGPSSTRLSLVASRYARTTPPVWLENLQCGGEEAALTDCGFRGWGGTDCTHSEAIHLLCAVPRKPPPPPPTPAPDPASLGSLGIATLAGAPLALGLTPVQLGALGGAAAVVGMLLVLGCALALCSHIRAAAGDHSATRALAPRREVHIALHGPAGESSEAQQALASALRKALQTEEAA